MVIVVPRSHTSLAAYSVARNIWTSIDVRSQPSVEIKPALYHGLAAAKVGNVIYAYSGQTASWASLNLSDTTATFVFQGAAMNVKDGDSLYVFGINSQAWSGIDLVTGQVILSGHQAGEQPHALEPAAGPVSNGESSPPAQ